MSYLKTIEYEIVTGDSFSVMRNCAGCGKKARFINMERFRVNANGNKIDVWLIYQCKKCKHTCNLAIYERWNPSLIPPEEYKAFLANDKQLAGIYGRDIQFFKKNKAEIDFGHINYCMEKRAEFSGEGDLVWIRIRNPYYLKIRLEKQIAESLGISRSLVKRYIDTENIKIEVESPGLLEVSFLPGLFHYNFKNSGIRFSNTE